MPDDLVTRRGFVSAVGIGAGVAVQGLVGNEATGSVPERNAHRAAAASGRLVWVASLCQDKIDAKSPEDNIRRMLARMEEVLPMQPDVICLPECFHVANLPASRPALSDTAEKPIGEISQPFADFAAKYRCNIICPIFTSEQGRFYNAAVVINRQGDYVGEYRKINPTLDELDRGFTPGPLDPPVFELDFGRIGIQICFDVNWHENWSKLRDKGAEMIFWPSAFAGGEMLKGLAWINKLPIVSSTRIQPTTIVDALGDEIVSTGRFGRWVCAPINLDFAVVQGWEMINKLDDVRQTYGRKVNVRIKHVEAWGMLESLSPDVSIPDVMKEFELQTSSQMLAQATQLQNAKRPRGPQSA